MGAELDRMVEAGAVRPVVGVRLPFEQAAEALRIIDRREALGKVVLER
jgi:NADPH2:quinone reductase